MLLASQTSPENLAELAKQQGVQKTLGSLTLLKLLEPEPPYWETPNIPGSRPIKAEAWVDDKTFQAIITQLASADIRQVVVSLGRVDGFDQDEAEGERDEGTVIARSLLATKGDALEALEFADGLLDARPRFVEDFREESGSVGCSRAMRNDRTNAALAGAVAIGFGVVTFVGDGGARQNIRSDVEQEFEVAAVAGFAPGQMEGERQAVEVDLEVDFG